MRVKIALASVMMLALTACQTAKIENAAGGASRLPLLPGYRSCIAGA